MDTWTKQMGLPYINVSIDAVGKKVTVEQRRFLADPATEVDPNTSPFRYMNCFDFNSFRIKIPRIVMK